MTLDPRFADVGIKLYYNPDRLLAREQLVRSSSNNVLVETLPPGRMGLPVAIVSTHSAGEIGIDILHPAILILTKLKRWSMSPTSTRPKTLQKAASDRTDIQFIIRWLPNHERIRFHEYKGKIKPQFLAMIRQYHDKYVDDVEHREKLQSIMPDDWDDMLALPPHEVESHLPP
ncbi:hypothetical protein BD414DRAFT_405473 [Trametes punicea]|nr:hypothetical protein BD414DRAFT_405473 [Trametes punicea]